MADTPNPGILHLGLPDLLVDGGGGVLEYGPGKKDLYFY